MDVPFSSSPIPELVDEIAIRWLRDPRQFRYVRQCLIDVSGNRGRPLASPHLIGWAVVRPNGRGGGYRRRIFFHQLSDLNGVYNDGRPPGDCIDPRSIRPGVGGLPPLATGGLYVTERRPRPRPPRSADRAADDHAGAHGGRSMIDAAINVASENGSLGADHAHRKVAGKAGQCSAH